MDVSERDLARKLRENPALLQSLMRSRDAQTLFRMLGGQDGGFRRAVQSAAQGDTEEIARRLRQVAQTPEGAAVMERLRRAAED